MCPRTHSHLSCTRYRRINREEPWQNIRFDQKKSNLFFGTFHFGIAPFLQHNKKSAKSSLWNATILIRISKYFAMTYSIVFVFVVCFGSFRFGLFLFLLFSIVCYQCIENIYIVALCTQSLGCAWVSFSRTSKKYFSMLTTHACNIHVYIHSFSLALVFITLHFFVVFINLLAGSLRSRLALDHTCTWYSRKHTLWARCGRVSTEIFWILTISRLPYASPLSVAQIGRVSESGREIQRATWYE